jgi:hypothetical protein
LAFRGESANFLHAPGARQAAHLPPVAGFRVILAILAHPENPDSNQDGRDEMQDGQDISACHPVHPVNPENPSSDHRPVLNPDFQDSKDFQDSLITGPRPRPQPAGVQHTHPGNARVMGLNSTTSRMSSAWRCMTAAESRNMYAIPF